VGGHGDDWKMKTAYLFTGANDGGAFEAAHFRHLDVHKDNIELCAGYFLQNRERLSPVVCHHDCVSTPLKRTSAVDFLRIGYNEMLAGRPVKSVDEVLARVEAILRNDAKVPAYTLVAAIRIH
jgi:hypothetical protein